MKIEHFQKQDYATGETETIQTSSIACPYCQRIIKMIVPRDSDIHDFRAEAQFFKEANIELQRRIHELTQAWQCIEECSHEPTPRPDEPPLRLRAQYV